MSLPIPVNIAMSKNALKQSIYPLGKKHYETTDWLGNVRVTYTDKKSWQQNKFALNVSSSQDYYPFGAVMEGRNLEITNYRFGFQGQEGDDEVYGKNNLWAYKYRLHDARLGRFFSVDPLADKYPNNSSYVFVANMPIIAIDHDGKDVYLIIYTTAEGESGHAAIAVENYKAIEITVIENGIEIKKTIYEKTGTFTFYEFGPDVKKPIKSLVLPVKGFYGKIENVTIDEIINKNLSTYESDENKPNGPNGVIKFTTTPETDLKIKEKIERKIASKEKYKALKNNCSDFAMEPVEEATEENISSDSKENIDIPILGTKKVTTPNALYKAAVKSKNATVVKDPKGEQNKSYRQARKGE
ncbi:MAG: hypothetical protein KatS3mg027_2662 [Bacteroidia bacterium]|nr:MAG: hypothetical protein KatS3mg027_2662 [Bacteroidia bacterium]